MNYVIIPLSISFKFVSRVYAKWATEKAWSQLWYGVSRYPFWTSNKKRASFSSGILNLVIKLRSLNIFMDIRIELEYSIPRGQNVNEENLGTSDWIAVSLRRFTTSFSGTY